VTFDLTVFLLFTVVIMGGAGYLTGQAIAGTWRPIWQLVAYSLLLGAFDRFLVYALFKGQLLSLSAFAIDSLVILAIAFLGFRLTRARIMVKQYPWIFERAGPLNWKRKSGE
tara:strand:- start:467 stop:802 length:336 start_codon:yes stop_codon:yes gene_type:complete